MIARALLAALLSLAALAIPTARALAGDGPFVEVRPVDDGAWLERRFPKAEGWVASAFDVRPSAPGTLTAFVVEDRGNSMSTAVNPGLRQTRVGIAYQVGEGRPSGATRTAMRLILDPNLSSAGGSAPRLTTRLDGLFASPAPSPGLRPAPRAAPSFQVEPPQVRLGVHALFFEDDAHRLGETLADGNTSNQALLDGATAALHPPLFVHGESATEPVYGLPIWRLELRYEVSP